MNVSKKRIGDEEVEVQALERHTVLQSSTPQPFTMTTDSSEEFAPTLGLVVSRSERSTIEDASTRATEEREEHLL